MNGWFDDDDCDGDASPPEARTTLPKGGDDATLSFARLVALLRQDTDLPTRDALDAALADLVNRVRTQGGTGEITLTVVLDRDGDALVAQDRWRSRVTAVLGMSGKGSTAMRYDASSGGLTIAKRENA